MRKLVSMLLGMAIVVSHTNSSAAELVITKVLEVGPGRSSLYEEPLKFSPDGSLLSYFSGRTLMVSDTLGNTREILQMDSNPIFYQWLNDNELVVMEHRRLGRGSDYRRMVQIEVSSNTMQVLAEHTRPPFGQTATTEPLNGPYLTTDRNVFFQQGVKHNRSPVFPISVNPVNRKLFSGRVDREAVWGDDGLYLVSLGTGDSTRIGPKPHEYMPFRPVVHPELTYVINGGTMMRIADSAFIVLDTMISSTPPGTDNCGVELPTFNPVYPEVVFNLVCYGGDEHSGIPLVEIDHMATYDYETNEIQVLDSLINIYNCTSPCIASDGLKIGFLSGGHVYILFRDEK